MLRVKYFWYQDQPVAAPNVCDMVALHALYSAFTTRAGAGERLRSLCVFVCRHENVSLLLQE